MRGFTRRQEEGLVVGDAIRVLVLGIERDEVRLGVEVPAGVDVRREEAVAATASRRRDLVVWHHDPPRLAEAVAARFPTAAEDVRVVGSAVAYFGGDPCLLVSMAMYAQGVRDGECGACRAM